MKPGKLLILVNDLGYFISHRLAIALAARQAGFTVSVGFGEVGNANISSLAEQGIDTYAVPMRRGGLNPFAELRCLFSIWRLFRQLRPELVHLVTMKPYLYGGIAARLARVGGVVLAVAGLGSVFVRQDYAGRLLRVLLYPLFYFAFRHKNQRVIVQNEHDRNVLMRWGVLKLQQVRLLRGSGVDLSKFTYLHSPPGRPVVSLAARLLREKGVPEFAAAARLLRTRGVKARFWLIGEPDPANPASLTDQELSALRNEGIVEVLGYRQDIAALYAQSHIVCLPSYYREGLPKALVEAAASGRAVVTADAPGCRDAIIPNETGLLTPVRNAEKLADALQWLIEHPRERAAMGRAGRALAEREFAIEKIVDQHMRIYQELLSKC